ncbi:glycosyltransferase family 52 [Polaromonas sp.]|uniref:glycosyltransferase family 52 n=1 Tax=Polaromonas sp. TaxID=1869339 RepID=UPI0017B06E08|nr:glycosyltransferase family 52 [Polaromonas sp.]NML86974.1 hypothetical protein [Polaromonas sp.]
MTEKALIFCRTPLQALIINCLLQLINYEVVVLYCPVSNNIKHNYYFEKIKTTQKYFVARQQWRFSDTLTDAIAWWRIPLTIRQTKFSHLLAASIGSIPFSFFAGRNKDAKIYTFDDGSFNVSLSTFSNWINSEPVTRRLVKILFGGCNNIDMLDKVARHYTIYENKFVVGFKCPIEELNLFDDVSKQKSTRKNKSVRILLGSLFSDSDIQSRHDKILQSVKFDLILPHPSDKHNLPVVADFLDSIEGFDPAKMIAEDLVLLLISTGFVPVTYGFNSTALINLARHSRVISIILDPKYNTIASRMMSDLNIRRMFCYAKNEKLKRMITRQIA